MSNKCIGCGIELQDKDVLLDGYVSSNDYRLCERCFRIKNYGQNKVVISSNDDFLKIMDMITDSGVFGTSCSRSDCKVRSASSTCSCVASSFALIF